MLLVELNRNTSVLREILLGICLNSGRSNVNSSAVKIIAQDLKDLRPVSLVHCYSIPELNDLISTLAQHNESEFTAKEIIPTVSSLGIIRDVPINGKHPESLTDRIYHYYRYYVLHEYYAKGERKAIVITYNPDLTELNNTRVQISESLRVNCGVMQVGNSQELKRLLEVKNIINETEGTYIVYAVNDLKEVL